VSLSISRLRRRNKKNRFRGRLSTLSPGFELTLDVVYRVDGVTRTLAMLLEHLAAEGHEAIVLGPASTLVSLSFASLIAIVLTLRLLRHPTLATKSSRQKGYLYSEYIED